MGDPSRESLWFPEVTRRLVELNASTITGRPRGACFDSELAHEIRSLEHATILLKRLQNAQKPLLRLPPEVLASITEYLLDEWPAFELPADAGKWVYNHKMEGNVFRFNPHADKRLLLGWILLGHVCHSLRGMLLSRQTFWSGIVCKSALARDVLLERCGDTPLNFTVDGPRFSDYKRAKGALQFIFEHLDRAHTIHVNTDCQHSIALFDSAKLLPKSMPHLTKLHICVEYEIKRVRLLNPDVPSLDAPQLTDLHLNNFIVPFSPSNLVNLTLKYRERYDALSADYFMDILRRSERLESLTVEKCLPLLPTAKPTSPAQLPKLQSVSFIDEPQQVTAAWMYIHAYQPTARFVLELDWGKTRPSPNDPAIPVPLQGNIQDSIAGLCIHDRSDSSPYGRHYYWDDAPNLGIMGEYDLSFFASREGATLCDWRDGRGDDAFKSGFERSLSTTFKRRCKTTPIAVLNNLIPVIDFGALTTLSLETAILNPPFEQWVEVLRPMIALHTLLLRAGTKSIVQALTPSPETADPDPLLPSLCLLWLRTLMFDKNVTAEDMPHDGLTTYTQMLESRARCGVPVQHLRIVKLEMESDKAKNEFIRHMKALVSLVEYPKAVPLPSRDPTFSSRRIVPHESLEEEMDSEGSNSEFSEDEY
ncbi:hypothetical protein PENSPDRAFT_747747 [Peniophora sp. CONT]|nr:hypothetical protein PENSPDRAFT_747747 [Peniophora sp. CONT]